MKACPNGHPVTDAHSFCQECGAATVDVGSTCPNGHAVQSGHRFCNECGLEVVDSSDVTAPLPVTEPEPTVVAPVPPPPPTPAPIPPPPTAAAPVPPPPQAPRKRRWPLVAAAVVLLGLLIAGGVWFATKSDDTVDVAGGQTSSNNTSTSTTAATPRTTVLHTPPTSSAAESSEVFYRQLDAILEQWVGNRGKLSDTLNSLGSCSDPTPAADQIRTIAVARQTELEQVNRLAAPDPASAAVKAALTDALDNSMQSDESYQQVVAAMTTCEPISPTDPNTLLVAARQTDQAATDAKVQFVAAYNPVAARYGLRADWVQADL